MDQPVLIFTHSTTTSQLEIFTGKINVFCTVCQVWLKAKFEMQVWFFERLNIRLVITEHTVQFVQCICCIYTVFTSITSVQDKPRGPWIPCGTRIRLVRTNVFGGCPPSTSGKQLQAVRTKKHIFSITDYYDYQRYNKKYIHIHVQV